MKFFWINSNDSIARQNFMIEQFSNLPFYNERVSTIALNQLKHFSIKKHNESHESDLELCCTLSHLKAIKKGYDENLEYFFVSEDYMFIPEIDLERLVQYISNYEKNNEKIDILQMFINGHHLVLKLFNEEFANGNLFIKKENNQYPGSSLYYISHEGAGKILNKYMQSIYDYDFSTSNLNTIDNILYRNVNSFILTYPFFVSNTNFSSQIQSDYKKFHVMVNEIIKKIHQKYDYNHLLLKKQKKRTIQVQLFAGLCNQLFMIFTTIAYAIRNNIDFSFYTEDYRTINNGNPVYFNNLLKGIKHKTTPHIITNFDSYQEQDFHYVPIPTNFDKNLNIKGFFQSEKYFIKEYDEIMSMLNINALKKEINTRFKSFFTKPCISIHFRQGDYLYLQYNHPILSKQYYMNAIQYLEKYINLNEYNILYFCQEVDNKSVSKMISEMNLSYNFIKVSDDITDWEQLLLMSLCQHHIIANSTFSWWGAYLCENKDKIVCTPLKKWFGPALQKHNTKDLCPSEWIPIEFE